jgi:hypothetical protein
MLRFTAALLVGLGARIFLDIITRPPEPSQRDAILTGIWQGVALYHTYLNYLHVLFLVAFGISVWLLIDFALIQDANRMSNVLLGVALGVFCAGLLSQIEGGSDTTTNDRRRTSSSKHDGDKPTSSSKKPRQSSSQQQQHLPLGLSTALDRSSRHHRRQQQQQHNHHHQKPPTISDITAPSLDTSTENTLDSSNMTPEREVASLRTRASLADTERRRYKEEKKWAVSQGNVARADQMRWQIKRYTTLMHSFNREADLLESSISCALCFLACFTCTDGVASTSIKHTT